MEDDVRVSWAVGTADVSALGAGLGGRIEEGTAAVAVSPYALDGLLVDEFLLRRPRRLGDLQAVLLGLLGDYVDGGVLVAVNLLWELAALTIVGGWGWLCCLLRRRSGGCYCGTVWWLVYLTEKIIGAVVITLTLQQLQVSLLGTEKVASAHCSNPTFRSPS
jgi:hypothetical protein